MIIILQALQTILFKYYLFRLFLNIKYNTLKLSDFI